MAPPTVKVQRTQKERSETTIGELLEASRRLFATNGYRATSLDDIARAVGVTKGAIYHHFQGKDELFRAVFEREEQRLSQLSAQAYDRRRDPWQGFYDGCKAWLGAAVDPGVQQIIFVDAPSVLGWTTVRETDANYALALITTALEAAMESGRIRRRPVKPLAHMLFGAMSEASMLVAGAGNATAGRQEMKRVLRELRFLLGALKA